MENNTEVIQQQMTDTRAALSEKLEALEEQVLSTVQDTTQNVVSTVESTVEDVKEAVQETVSNVTESVQETVSNVTETVQETVSETVSTFQRIFDLRGHVENYPWAMFAGAVVVGYVGGQLLLPRSAPSAAEERAVPPPSTGLPSHLEQGSTYNQGTTQESTLASTATGLLDTLGKALGPALEKIKEMAIGTTAGMVGDMLLSATPENLRESVTEVIDQVTTSLGGKPLRDWGQQGQDHSQPQGNGQEPGQQRRSGQSSPGTPHHAEAQQLKP
jgi:predicted RecB family endonuclease